MMRAPTRHGTGDQVHTRIFSSNLHGYLDEAAIEALLKAGEQAGYRPGEDFCIALDCAASEWASEAGYVLTKSGQTLSREALLDRWRSWVSRYPICSMEDGAGEEDWTGWQTLTRQLGDKIQLVGDDLFVTNVRRLSCGIALGTANAVLIKVNQIGTLSEALDAVEMAQRAGYRAVISHRSGETEDDFLADLAVATGQIKTGAPCRSERNAKYNELLRIEERLGEEAKYRNPFPQKGTGVREW